MLRKALTFTSLLVLSFCANAALYDRGNGLIYDDVQNITWLQDANYSKTSGYDSDGLMNWHQASDWANNLEFGGASNWRLASVGPAGSTNYGINDGELAKIINSSVVLYALGQEPQECPEAPTPCIQPPSTPIASVFSNLENGYWYAEEQNSTDAWDFQYDLTFNIESLGSPNKNSARYAWAVADGDIANPVPIPAAAWLFGSALIGLAGIKRKK